MTTDELMRLKPGDRVKCWGFSEKGIPGTVKFVSSRYVFIDYDDGYTGGGVGTDESELIERLD